MQDRRTRHIHPAFDAGDFPCVFPQAWRDARRLLKAMREAPGEGLGILANVVTGKRKRARNRLDALLGAEILMDAEGYLRTHPVPPITEPVEWQGVLGILVDARPLATPTPERIAATLASVQAQSPVPLAAVCCMAPETPPSAVRIPDVRIVCAPGAGLAMLRDEMKADAILLLRAGDVLAPQALMHFLSALAQDGVTAAYADERLSLDDGRSETDRIILKRAWDPHSQLGGGLAEAAVALRGAALHQIDLNGLDRHSGAEIRALMLQLDETESDPAQSSLRHVPHVLIHRQHACAGNTGQRPLSDLRAEVHEARRLLAEGWGRARYGRCDAEVSIEGFVRLRPRLCRETLVSIIIPTRDRVDLLRPCVESIFRHTRRPDFEIIVVDNGSQDSATLDYMHALEKRENVSIIRDDGPFNFSRLNNRAAAVARGEVLLLLNNDTEVLHDDWLEILAARALDPRTGAVGALLLYPHGHVQHAGVCLNIDGGPAHAHQHFPSHHPGYAGRLRFAQHYAAVTAACLAVERRKYMHVEGLDESTFAVTMNDVDLCLRLEAAGWRTLWEPAVRLLHKESATRRRDRHPAERARWMRELQAFRDRWQERMRHDPACHPGHERSRPHFSVIGSSDGPGLRP